MSHPCPTCGQQHDLTTLPNLIQSVKKLLTQLEWGGEVWGEPACPSCCQMEAGEFVPDAPGGTRYPARVHAPDCKLKKLLDEVSS